MSDETPHRTHEMYIQIQKCTAKMCNRTRYVAYRVTTDSIVTINFTVKI